MADSLNNYPFTREDLIASAKNNGHYKYLATSFIDNELKHSPYSKHVFFKGKHYWVFSFKAMSIYLNEVAKQNSLRLKLKEIKTLDNDLQL